MEKKNLYKIMNWNSEVFKLKLTICLILFFNYRHFKLTNKEFGAFSDKIYINDLSCMGPGRLWVNCVNQVCSP